MNMNFQKILGRLMTFLMMSVVIMLCTIMTALAAAPTISNVTYRQQQGGDYNYGFFYVNIPGYTAEETAFKIEYDYEANFTVILNGNPLAFPAPVIEEIRNANDQVVHEFGKPGQDSRYSGHIALAWDGKCSVSSGVCQQGEYVPEGYYKIIIKSTNNNDWNAAAQFMKDNILVVHTKAFGLVQKDPAPLSIYTPNGNNPYVLTYQLKKENADDKSSSTLFFTIKGGNDTVEIEKKHSGIEIPQGYPTVSWDGKINGVLAPEGNYEYSAVIVSKAGGFPVESNKLIGTFKVEYPTTQNPNPTPNPSNPSPSPNPTPSQPTPVTVVCGGFTDVKVADCPVVEYVKSIGAMTGYANGDFGPDNALNRAEISKIIEVTFKQFDSSKDYCSGVKPFHDVPKNLWAFQYICRGKQLGMITGYLSGPDAGYYRPERNVNRAEFLALLLRNLSETMPSGASYQDVGANDWYSGYAKFSYTNKLFLGDMLQPTLPINRIEVAKALHKLHTLGKI